MTDATGRPDWVTEQDVVGTLDAREMIAAGGHPLPQVLSAIEQLEPGKIFMVIAPFTPTPMIDKVRNAGDMSWTEQVGPAEFRTYFKRGG